MSVACGASSIPSGGTLTVPFPVKVACPLEGTWPFAQVLGGVLTVGRTGTVGVMGNEDAALGIAGAGVIVVTGGMMMGSLRPAISLLLPLWLPSLAV